MRDSIDVSRAPRGEIAAAELVESVARIGDLAERHYIELKGPRDLSSKAQKQKIAKFILGAANRLIEKAAEAFEGCAVMILGVTENGVEGLPPIETLELSKVVQPFLGVPGPKWDIVRVPVPGSDRQVLVVIVEPPQLGQPVYICRANGEGLADGRVYIRAEGETREANSAEQDALRAQASRPVPTPVDLGVSVVGKVVPVVVEERETLEDYLAVTRRRLMDHLRREQESTTRTGSTGRTLDESHLTSTFGLQFRALFPPLPEDRTKQEYLKQIDEWESGLRAAWPGAVLRLAGHVCDAAEAKVENKTRSFLHDLQVTVHLEGTVRTVDFFARPNSPAGVRLNLPAPPRKWGPRQQEIPGGDVLPESHWRSYDNAILQPPASSWRNSGSVDIEVHVGDLRPEATFVTADEEAVLVIFGEAPAFIKGTWRATARDHNEVFTGECRVDVTEPRNLTRLLRAVLRLDSQQKA